jgi:glycine dehydrogenase subunit 2
MSIAALKEMLTEQTAGIMLTCANTLGLFNPHIKEVCELVHSVDGLAYCDGANLNAIVGKVRPADAGFDMVHVNLHKTFATPHGGGGPGAGPVGVVERLAGYLPVPLVVRQEDGTYALEYDRPKSIGCVSPFYGNFGVILRAYVYLLMVGREGLERIAENAVLNANYIKEKLKPYYEVPYPGLCKHECVISAVSQLHESGIHALDIAKALIDAGFHPPTMYFPAIVKEALMIEPTECESRETLDAFIEAMIDIAEKAKQEPQTLKAAPLTTPVGRLDETKAARQLNIACL